MTETLTNPSGKLTPEVVKSYWKHMTQFYDVEVKKKSGSKWMSFIRPFTGMSKELWARYSTTIGHTIYTDVIPGVATSEKSLLGQVCLITHECQHVVQSDNLWIHGVSYLLSSASRTKWEADAYTCNVEMCYRLTHKMITVESILEKLKNYTLSPGDLEAARKTLEARIATIKAGGLITTAAKTGTTFFTALTLEAKRSVTSEEYDLDLVL